MMKNIVKAVKDYNQKIKVVVVGYADAHRVGSVEPRLIPKIASEAKCDLAMLDTAVKDGKNLLDFLNTSELKTFVDKVHSHNLKAALAGSLKIQNLPVLQSLDVDIIGIRGAACTNNNRVTGRIDTEKVKAIVKVIRNSEKLCRTVNF